MKRVLVGLVSMALFSGCSRSSDEMWNDSQSAGRHMKRGVQTLGGKHGDSREVRDPNDFLGMSKEPGVQNQDDFLALGDSEEGFSMRLGDGMQVPAARETPGELGSSLPGIEAFRDPADDPELAPIFQRVHFEYNSSLIKDPKDIATLQKIGQWLQSHPGLYIFIEGHCDSRGPAAYNMSLGANRANAVRAFLIKEGASPDHLFPISYGKEKPLVEGEGEAAWRLNRRAQFRVYGNE